MKHGDVRIGSLLPSNQYPPKAIHPTVRPLHDPATGLVPRPFLDRLGLFSTGTNVRREPKLVDQLSGLGVVVPFVHGHVLGIGFGRLRTLDRDALNRGLDQLEVVPIGAVDREAERDTCPIRKQASLRPALRSIRWIGAGFFPLRAVPSSWPRPSTASSNRCRRRPRGEG